MGIRPYAALAALMFAASLCSAAFGMDATAIEQEEHAPAFAGPIQIALIAGYGQRAPDMRLVELLEVALSEHPDAVLLDRTAIDTVLREHQLTALSSREEMLTLGRVLEVELFIIVEAMRPGGNLLAVRLVEARTGIVLADAIFESFSLETDMEGLTSQVTLALSKLSLPAPDRRYVGIAGFHSEDLGHELDGVAAAISCLLGADLNASPSIVMLERQHLETLVGEHDLTGVDVMLKSSAILISGGIRTDRQRDSWEISFTLSSVGGVAESAVTTVTSPRGDLPRAREMLASAVREHLHIMAPKLASIDPAAEAAMFARRVEFLTQRQYNSPFTGEYLRPPRETASAHAALAEAAYALHPTQEHLHMVAALAADPRGKRLFRQYWQNEEQRLIEAGKAPVRPNLKPPPGMAANAARIVSIAQMQIELEALCHELACRSVSDPRHRHYWWGTLQRASRQFHRWCVNMEEWDYFLRCLITLATSPPEAVDRHSSFAQFLFSLPYINEPLAAPLEAELEKTLQWMREQDHFAFTICSYAFQVRRKSNDSGVLEPARRLLDYVQELSLSPLLWPPEFDQFVMYWVDFSLLHISIPDETGPVGRAGWQERHTRLAPILKPFFESDDTRRLLNWLSYQLNSSRPPTWLEALRQATDNAEAAAWLEPVIERLRDYQAGQLLSPVVAQSTEQFVLQLERHLAEIQGKQMPVPAEWQRFEFRQLKSEDLPDGADLLAGLTRDGDRLVMVWVERYISWNRPIKISVTALPLTGGRHKLLATSHLSVDVERKHQELSRIDDPESRRRAARVQSTQFWRANTAVTGVIMCGDTIFVGTNQDGLIVFRRGKGEVWREERLPSRYVGSLATLDGTLYAWFTEGLGDLAPRLHGVLCRYDPQTDTFTELVSTKATNPGNALETGKALALRGMLGDESRRCLWLGMLHGHRGLWRYDLDSGEFRQVHRRPTGNMAWHGTKLLMEGMETTLALYDPDTDKLTGLLDSPSPPMFGGCVRFAWPVALIGGELITLGRGSSRVSTVIATAAGSVRAGGDGILMLDTTSTGIGHSLPAMPDGSTPRIRHLLSLGPDSAIAADDQGNCWHLSRSARGRRTAEILYRRPDQEDWQDLFDQGNIVSPATVSASSAVAGFPPEQAFDLNFRTCWAAAPEDTDGAWIEFSFEELIMIDRIVFINGWIRSAGAVAAYNANHRAQTVTVQYDSGAEESFRLRDLSMPQVFVPTETATAKTVRITIDDIYRAPVFNQADPPWLNISQIMVFRKPDTEQEAGK